MCRTEDNLRSHSLAIIHWFSFLLDRVSCCLELTSRLCGSGQKTTGICLSYFFSVGVESVYHCLNQCPITLKRLMTKAFLIKENI